MDAWKVLIRQGRSQKSRADDQRNRIEGIDSSRMAEPAGLRWLLRRLLMPASTGIARKLRLHRVDFLNCNFDSVMFDRCEFVDCTFIACKFPQAGCFACRFSDCSFSQCDLRQFTLAPGCQFQGVRFARVDLRGSHASDVSFKSCEFLLCKLRRFRFNHCRLTQCIFQGPVEDTTFFAFSPGGSGPESKLCQVDFSGTDPCEIRIFQIQTEHCQFPEGGTLWRPQRVQLQQLIEQLESCSDEASRVVKAVLAVVLRDMHPLEERGLLYLPVLGQGERELLDRMLVEDVGE